MVSFRMVDGDAVSLEELLALYEAVGWTSYTNDPQTLRAAIAGSSTIVIAEEDDHLIGLARVISDGASICYLQDVLVSPDHQHSGIGRELVSRVLAPYAHVRQKVLLTDDEPGQKAFYESLGYSEVGEFGEGTLRAFVRFD